MWGFILLAGTCGWLILFKIIRPGTTPVPDREDYTVKKANEEAYAEGAYKEEWVSRKGRGRRKWCGDLLQNLTRKERQAVLAIMREHLLYVRWLAGEEGTWRHLHRLLRWYSPVCYFLDDVPHVTETVRARIFGPVAWVKMDLLGSRSMTVSFDEWARCVHAWYTD